MGAFEELKEVYQTSIKLEKELSDLYDVAELGLKNPESLQVIKILAEEHRKRLGVLKNVDVSKFGNAEWIKNPPRFDRDEVVLNRKLTQSSSPQEILQVIEAYHHELERFYQAVHDKLMVHGQKELFASLVVFKRNQADGIHRLLEDCAAVD